MAEQHINIIYSAADIERYLLGQMTQKEMHEIERAALQDSFLADAIEGYQETSFTQSHKHLNEITAALHAKNNDAKIIPIKSKSFSWLRVAAMVILLAGVGSTSWYFLSLQNKNKATQSVAQLKEEKTAATVQDSNLINPPENDTTITATPLQNSDERKTKKSLRNEEVIASGKANAEDAGGVSASTIPIAAEKDKTIAYSSNQDSSTFILNQNKSVTTDIVSLNETANAPLIAKPETAIAGKLPGLPVTKNKNADISANNLVVAKGRVIDYNNTAVPFATITAEDNKKAVTADANGFFNIPVTDTNVNVKVASIGYESKLALLNTNTDNTILLMPGDRSLSEIVVSSYGVKKSARVNSQTGEAAVPQGGWQAFSNYVKQELNAVIDSSHQEDMTFNGDLEIEFLIDDNGNPFNFHIIKPLEQTLNSKAIELLKDGPRWIPAKKNKKGKVIIEFR